MATKRVLIDPDVLMNYLKEGIQNHSANAEAYSEEDFMRGYHTSAAERYRILLYRLELAVDNEKFHIEHNGRGQEVEAFIVNRIP